MEIVKKYSLISAIIFSIMFWFAVYSYNLCAQIRYGGQSLFDNSFTVFILAVIVFVVLLIPGFIAGKVVRSVKAKPNITGINGWLIVLVIFLFMNAIFYGLYSLIYGIFFMPHLAYNTGDFILITYEIITFIAILLSAFLLLKKSKGSVNFIIISLWLPSILNILIFLVYPFFDFDSCKLIGSVDKTLISAILASMWMVYLKNSQRVKNTISDKRN